VTPVIGLNPIFIKRALGTSLIGFAAFFLPGFSKAVNIAALQGELRSRISVLDAPSGYGIDASKAICAKLPLWIGSIGPCLLRLLSRIKASSAYVPLAEIY
jgi:hypothetical protein